MGTELPSVATQSPMPVLSRDAATDAPVRPSLDRYLANLAALYASDPALAQQIESTPFAAIPTLTPTRDEGVTAAYVGDDGRTVALHSRYAPATEAETLVRQQSARASRRREKDAAKTTAESAEHERANETYILLGMGLGHHVAAVERIAREPVMIVVERELALVKAALMLFDFSEPLRSRRLTLITSADKGLVHDRLRAVLTHIMLGATTLTLPHSARVGAAFYATFMRLFRDFVQFSRLQLYTLVRNARITLRNVAMNLPHYLASPGVEVLADRAKGFPAVLVAAGPSLAKNLDKLAALRDRAVIIAVQTVLKTLLAHGIRPHFVTSLDYHEISAEFFRQLGDAQGVRLVAEPKANWTVLDAFPGQTHVLRSSFVDDLLQQHAPPRGALRAGSTVAHLSYYLAEHLGCDPIIFVGQDLSFSEGLYYPPGTPIEQIWAPELGRFNTLEMKQWERVARQRSGLRKVLDVHGREVYTDEQLYVYAEQFQADFTGARGRIIQASEGGMRLAGAQQMPFDDAVRQFCMRPMPASWLDGASSGVVCEPEVALHELESRQSEVEAVRQIADETSKLLVRLEGLLDRPADFNRLVPQVDELRSRMARHGRTYEVVVQAAQLGELQRINADRSIRDDQDETVQTARRRLARDRQFVQALLDGCAFLLELLPEARKRLREGGR